MILKFGDTQTSLPLIFTYLIRIVNCIIVNNNCITVHTVYTAHIPGIKKPTSNMSEELLVVNRTVAALALEISDGDLLFSCSKCYFEAFSP